MPCTKPNLLSASRESQRTTHHKVGRAEKGKFQGFIFDSSKPKWQNFVMPAAESLKLTSFKGEGGAWYIFTPFNLLFLPASRVI